jgi:signal transduction histidine kinase
MDYLTKNQTKRAGAIRRTHQTADLEPKYEQVCREVQLLMKGQTQARDEEARRIALVLHDEAGQLLANVYITLDEIAKQAPASIQTQLSKAKTLLDQAEERLRNIAHELHPATLDALGLLPSLKSMAAQIAKRTFLQIVIEGEITPRLVPALELTVYRVVQEALNNAARHARAHLVRVELRKQDGIILCFIEDDGIGLDVQAISNGQTMNGEGLGLLGMRERAQTVGGSLEILSTPKRGTKLIISIPDYSGVNHDVRNNGVK